ncbi:divergent PAP2 family protein [Isobaculum melis]|uniref:Divergent PAP2 family protein n=1 Tax=Isobaculum melis TaxID=142588 RepID=A0A1H9QQH9_9LACT|nr:divergent PAP2 family protein [Isobaculum melis]SER62698.1 hypothetical protein SAMN04488559_102221 [Isobaculum melis]
MSLLNNFSLVSAFFAMTFSQLIKIPISIIFRKKVNWSLITSTGGMPSSHSASVSALITALILQNGFASPYVAIAGTFGVIVMFDAMGVRRASGEQGIVLNHLIEDFQALAESVKGIATTKQKRQKKMHLKEMLGHKPLEVVCGALLGIGIAFLTQWLFLHFGLFPPL